MKNKYELEEWIVHILITLFYLGLIFLALANIRIIIFHSSYTYDKQYLGIFDVAFFFGMSGGLAYGILSLYRHWAERKNWDNRWATWYAMYPILGGLMGIISFSSISYLLTIPSPSSPSNMLFPALTSFLAGFKSKDFLSLLLNKHYSKTSIFKEPDPTIKENSGNIPSVSTRNHIIAKTPSTNPSNFTRQNTGILRDQIYGDIPLDRHSKSVIADWRFQRLRRIKQTGFTHLVFPGMCHTRFEHSIGAKHLAKCLFANFTDSVRTSKFETCLQAICNSKSHINIDIVNTRRVYETLTKPESNIRWQSIFELAALLHDVGHGPFSHTSEKIEAIDFRTIVKTTRIENRHLQAYCSQNFNPKYKHETVGAIIAGRILEEQTDLNDREIAITISLFHRDFLDVIVRKWLDDEKQTDDTLTAITLSQLISGLIDVDRLDYISRDSYCAGVNYGVIEIDRLLNSIQPILTKNRGNMEGSLLLKAKHSSILDHFIFNLFQLYVNVYLHPAVARIEHEFIRTAKHHIGENRITSIDDFLKLNDSSIIYEFGDQTTIDLIESIFSRRSKPIDENATYQIFGAKDLDVRRLKNEGWHLISDRTERKIVSESDKIILLEELPFHTGILRWDQVSPIASLLKKEVYKPEIWWKNKILDELIDKTKTSA